MKNRILKLLKIDLVKHNIVFLFGTLAISVFNYLYYPVVGRLVSIVEFGEIQASISIFMQLGILLTAFGYVVANITHNSQSDYAKQNILFLERVTLLLSVLTLVVLIVFGRQLQSTLQFSSILPLVLIGILVILNVPSTTRSYVLQGMKRLKEVAISGIIFSIGKLVVTVVLILAGVNAEAAIIGYIIAQIVTLFYLSFKSKDYFPSVRLSFAKTVKVTDRVNMKRELKFGLLVIILLAGLSTLYSFDVVLARLFLTPEAAGEYSGVSSVARIIYFATASVAGVLIASVALKDSYSRSRRVLLGSALIVTVIGLVILAIFSIFPTESLTIILGSSYAHVASLLPLVCLFMFVASLNNLLITFQIARRKYNAVVPVVLGVLGLSGFLVVKHSSVQDLVLGYIIANVVIFVILTLQIARRNKNE